MNSIPGDLLAVADEVGKPGAAWREPVHESPSGTGRSCIELSAFHWELYTACLTILQIGRLQMWQEGRTGRQLPIAIFCFNL